jgi:hypothetical protein
MRLVNFDDFIITMQVSAHVIPDRASSLCG